MTTKKTPKTTKPTKALKGKKGSPEKKPVKKAMNPKGKGPRCKIGGLSADDRKFFDAYISDGNFNGMRTYLMLHPDVTPESARSHAPLVMKRVRPFLEKWLDDIGLSDTALKTKLAQLLNARETKFFAHEGVVVSEVDVEALHIQTKALELAMKARGMLSEKSAKEVAQIDQLIEIELAKLALARQGADAGAPEKTE